MKSVLITITMPLKRCLPGQFSDVYIFMVFRHKVRKTLTVSKPNRKHMLQWCKSLKCHTIDNYWKNVIFSDETQVVISKENRLYVCKTADEAYHPACVGEHGRNVRISAMFWVRVTYSGVGKLLPITGKF